MTRFDKSGFTLIEIIVVLIIVGILAAIALPNLFGNVSKNRAQEAMGSISGYRPSMEGCIVGQAGVSNNACTTTVVGPLATTPNFVYTVTGPTTTTDTSYIIVANGQGTLASTDSITVARSTATWPSFGSVTCVSTGAVSGAC